MLRAKERTDAGSSAFRHPRSELMAPLLQEAVPAFNNRKLHMRLPWPSLVVAAGRAKTHLPSGLAVVSQVRALAVAVALTERIAALTDWDAQNISATPELREQVREALNRAYGDFFANRLPAFPEDALLAECNPGATTA